MNYNLSTTATTVLIGLAAWELTWKGIALWKASRANQKGWYVTMLIVNTVGVLPIVYLLTHRKHKTLETGGVARTGLG